MQVHVSVDMEGVAGVADPADVVPGSDQYEASRRLMTDECNAVVEGCFDAGATHVVVNDATAQCATSSEQSSTREPRTPRWPAGRLAGVPLVPVSGDDGVCGEARGSAAKPGVLGDDVEVKRAVDRCAASSLHPAEAPSALRAGARRALERLGDAVTYRVGTPATVSVEWASTSSAALCEGVPGVARVSARGVRFSSDDYAEAYRPFIVLGLLVGGTEAPRR